MRVMGRETTAQKRDIELTAAVYRRGLARFVERVEELGEASWRGSAGDEFHRVLAHLAVAQENGLQLIRESLNGRVTLPEAGTVSKDGSEAEFMEESPTGLLAHVERVVEKQIAILLALADDGLLETPAVVPEWRYPGNLGRLFDHLYVHLVVHYEEIRSAVGGPFAPWFEAWMPEASNDFYDRLFRVVPLVYNREGLAEQEVGQAAICVDLMQPGGGRWTLLLDVTSARSENGCEGETTSTIKAKPREFFDFFRGQGKRVKISGRGDAARNLGALFRMT